MSLMITSLILVTLTLTSSWEKLAQADWTMTVLHTNDVHSHYLQFDVRGSPCKADRSGRNVTNIDVKMASRPCYGGQARLTTAIREERARNPGNTLLLDGGDQYTGTALFFVFGASVVKHFMEWQGYDAMALGNHEFDQGVAGLTPFLKNVLFPVLSANIDVSLEPDMAGLIYKSVIFNISGHKVGVIGFTTEDAPELSKTGKIKFNSIVTSVLSQVERLKEVEVSIIIALGHAGFSVDQQVALIPGVDLVVGGHTNTFLYTGTAPSSENPEEVYPYVIHRPDGSKALIVQDYTRAKYLGVLNITFNDQGDVIGFSGNPRLLDSDVDQDPATVAEMARYTPRLERLMSRVVGRTLIKLEGDRTYCMRMECTLGDVVADSMVKQTISTVKQTLSRAEWDDVTIGLMNGGGLRDTIDIGDITMEHILNVLPFSNTMTALQITGTTLREAFEHSVSLLNPCNSTDLSGRFLQVSGVKVSYDLRQNVGQRVRTLSVLRPEIWDYCPLNDSAIYKVVINSFLEKGGDGYSMFRDKALTTYNLGYLDTDMLREYLERNSPFMQTRDGRIEFYVNSNICDSIPVQKTTLVFP